MIDRREFLAGLAASVAVADAAAASAPEREPNFAHATPSHVARVGLKARDPGALEKWYGEVLGLSATRSSGAVTSLGSSGTELLEIEGSAAFILERPGTAGLYHTAFLLPSRAELARWVRHAVERGIRVDGASDHVVSEAFYLTDPEGNGVEIYADRDSSSWRWTDGQVEMGSRQIDLEGLLRDLDPTQLPWADRPGTAVIGHVHLRVGDIPAAERFWNGAPGLDTVRRRDGSAVFLSSGGYHHHIAANTWQSLGAPLRNPAHTGLSFVEMASRERSGASVTDPWGNEVRFVRKA